MTPPRPPLIVVRAQPGANATATRAQSMGLDAVALPLFAIERLSPRRPRGSFDAILVTSANAARHMPNWERALPIFAVGEATALALRERGLTPVLTGSGDGAAIVVAAAARGHRALLWPTGAQHSALAHPNMRIVPVPVYAARRLPVSPSLRTALAQPAIVLAHSARGAMALADAAAERGHLRLIAISEAVADAAGGGWASLHWPARPRDADMLELARRLCQKRLAQREGL